MDAKRELSHRITYALMQVEDWEKLKKKLSVSAATFSKWRNGQVGNLKSAHLFSLSDMSGLSARWIALGEGPEQVSETKEEKEQILLRRFRRLEESAQEHVLSTLSLLVSTQFTGDEEKRKKFQESISSNAKASA